MSNRIAEHRTKRGWSQQRLAVEADLHVQTVSEAEREYRGEPAEATWEAIARALDTTVEELKGQSAPDPEPEPEVEVAGEQVAS